MAKNDGFLSHEWRAGIQYRGHSHTASFSEQHKDDDDEGRIWH